MTLKTGFGLAFMLCLLIGGGYWLSTRSYLNPDLSFTTIDGQTLTLKKLNGKPVLVNFWATDCPSCIAEIPHLIELHRQYAHRGLSIIAVAMYYDPPNHVLTLAKDQQLPYAVALDPEQTLAKAFGNVQLTPTSFLLNGDGNIVWKQLGSIDRQALQQKLDALLPAD